MSGILRGGDFAMSLWQVNAVIYLPIVFLLFQTSFRGPKDHWNLAKIVLAAATYRALLATYVVYTTVLPMDPTTGNTKPPYGTAHADSVLFSSAILIIVGMVLERVHRRTKWLVVGLLPIIILGTHANGRRLAWVQIGVALLMVYLVSRDNPVKRALRRAVVVGVPFVALYVLIGWDRTYGAVWKPVRLIRSVVDAKSDGSSMWREYENVNIIATFRSNPIFGTGYGHPYQEVIVLPAIEYPLERWIPHNSLLGLWGYSGLIGFLGVTLLWTTGVYFAMRAYHKATDPSQRAGALVAFGVVPIYMMQAWGDLGLGQWTGVYAMGAALTVAGKVAVACGQWPGAAARKTAATSAGAG
jgi:O-antigen ligase